MDEGGWPGARTRVVGILGWPLEHSLSPRIHNAAFRRLGLDWVYVAFPVRPERLGEAISGLRGLGVVGANVTMPYKERVVTFLDRLGEKARRVGAVNTLVVRGDDLVGENTDAEGFARSLEEERVQVAGKGCLVLGAGGAARAVALALVEAGGEVWMAARRKEVGEEAATRVGASFLAMEEVPRLAPSFDVVVNATPIGWSGEPSLVPGEGFRRGQVVVDLVYGRETQFLTLAREAGARPIDGSGMLLHQAALAFLLWTGLEPPLDAMRAALEGRSGG